MRRVATVLLFVVAVAAGGCAAIEEAAESVEVAEALNTTAPQAAVVVPPEQVSACVEQIKFGAFTADPTWTHVWNVVGQTDDGATGYCYQKGVEDPAGLLAVHDQWQNVQAFLAAPAPAAPVQAAPGPEAAPVQTAPASQCDPNYGGCVPIASDVDCEGGDGDGPAYVVGPVQVIGTDIYGLDHDGDRWGC